MPPPVKKNTAAPQLADPLQHALIPLFKKLPEHWQMMDEILVKSFVDKTDWTDEQRTSIGEFFSDLSLAFSSLSDATLVSGKLVVTEFTHNNLMLALEWISAHDAQSILSWMFEVIYSHHSNEPERVCDFAHLHKMLNTLHGFVKMHLQRFNGKPAINLDPSNTVKLVRSIMGDPLTPLHIAESL